MAETRTAEENPGQNHGGSHRHEGTGRLEAFSDGVFAIAATLLVLTIKIPAAGKLSRVGLYHLMAHQWPSFVSYAISFISIGILWANHHAMFKCFKRTDHVFLLLNILFLMFVALMPFPTALLAQYLAHDIEERGAALLYIALTFVVSLLFGSLWLYATHHRRLVDPDLDASIIRTIRRNHLIAPLLFLVAFLLAFWHVEASLVCYALPVLLYILPAQHRW